MKPIARLLQELESEDEEKLLSSIGEIFDTEIRDASLLPRLLKLAELGSEPVRYNAIAALRWYGELSPKVAEYLESVFFSSTEPDRIRTLAAASLVDISSAIPIFRRAIDSNSTLLIVEALGFLTRFEEIPLEFVPRLVELFHSSDNAVHQALFECFSNWPGSIEFLCAHFEKVVSTRSRTALAGTLLNLSAENPSSLSRRMHAKVLDSISAVLGGVDEGSRTLAICLLANYPGIPKELIPSLKDAYDRTSDFENRASIIQILNRHPKYNELRGQFTIALKDPHPEVRLTAMLSKTVSENVDSMSTLLEEILFDESEENRVVAAELLTSSQVVAQRVRESLSRAYVASSDQRLREILAKFVSQPKVRQDK
jgi:hypothetical protein